MTKWYCDTSYNNQHNIGVIGYKSEHTNVYTYICNNIKNTELEFNAFEDVLNYIHAGDSIYTDCQRITDLVGKRNPKYDYQKRLLNRIDNTNVEIIKIDGHKPTREKDENDIQFSLVDKAVRRHLRSLCK